MHENKKKLINIERGDFIIKNLFKAVAVLTIFSVLTRILGFIYRVVLSRTLTPELLGIYSIAISIFMVFATALNSGLPLAVSKTTASCIVDNNNKKAHKFVTSALIISLLVSAFVIVFLLVSKQLFTALTNDITYTMLLLLIPAVLFTGIYAPFRGYLWGKEKYLQVSLVEFIENIIRISVCFVAFMIIGNTSTILPAAVALSAACVLSTILGIVFYYKQKGRLENPKNHYKEIWLSAAPITGIRLASSLMQPLIAIIIPFRLLASGLTNEQALAQLGIAMGMTLPILSIPGTLVGSLATAIIPKITSLVKTNENNQIKKQIKTATNFTFVCCFISLPAFIAIGEPITKFIFANEMAGTYLSAGSWIIVPMGIAQLTTSILNSLGLEVKTFKYYLYSAVVLLACIWFLPPMVGIYALMYGMGISMTLVSILNILKINKTMGTKNNYIFILLKLILITIPSAALTYFCYNIMQVIFPSFITLTLCGIISILTFLLLLWVCNVIDVGVISFKPQLKKEKN